MATLDVLSLAEAKAAIGQDTTSDDATLPPVITAVSLALDEGAGPIVVRTLTDEVYDGGQTDIQLAQWPVTSITSVTEYDGTTAQVLTAETNASKPVYGYRTEPYRGQPTGLLGPTVIRRGSGADARFPADRSNVVVTYVAGRFATTSAVSELFKEAARITLMHWWRTREQGTFEVVLDGGDGFEVPRSNFPRWAVPNAAKELLGSEWQAGLDQGDGNAGSGPVLYDV